jgi:transcriptional regulator GlxA family with amidase domain
VLHYIHKHYQEPIRLKELAIQANMSEGHFCRFFRDMMRKSPSIMCIVTARSRLPSSWSRATHQIAAIALDTGFDEKFSQTRDFSRELENFG